MVKTPINVPKAIHAFPAPHKKIIAKEKDKKTEKKPKIKKSYLHILPSNIANKHKRHEILFKRQKELKKFKKTQKKERQTETKAGNTEVLQPLTTDDKREYDETFITEEDHELIKEEEQDEFAEFFDEKITPKILMTTSERPSGYCFQFLKEIKDVFPNCFYYPRRNYTLQEICQYAPNKGYTDIMVWRENQKEIASLILIHLPKGPTAHFKVTNLKLNQEIYHHGNPTDHFPELILNNFNTRIGRRIGRFFAALFPPRPEFKGRRVVTLHNQRDFIFFRHHRYAFENDFSKTNLQEIGPRFTLKLEKIQHGTFDNQFGQLEWLAKPDMYVSRKAAFL